MRCGCKASPSILRSDDEHICKDVRTPISTSFSWAYEMLEATREKRWAVDPELSTIADRRGGKGVWLRNMSSSNIQGLAGFSIYAAGQCRNLGVLEIDGQPRQLRLGGSCQHVCVACRIIVDKRQCRLQGMTEAEKSDRVAGRPSREGAWPAPIRFVPSRQDSTFERGADQVLGLWHHGMNSRMIRSGRLLIHSLVYRACICACGSRSEPRISLVAAFMESTPQARGQSSRVRFRSPANAVLNL